MVDLSLSGIGSTLFNTRNYGAVNVGSPAPAPLVLFDPAVIFSPTGRLEWVTNPTSGTLFRPTDDVYFLIGRRDLMYDAVVGSAPQAKDIVFQNLSPVPNPANVAPTPAENFWLTIGAQTGQVSVTEIGRHIQDYQNQTGNMLTTYDLHTSSTSSLAGDGNPNSRLRTRRPVFRPAGHERGRKVAMNLERLFQPLTPNPGPPHPHRGITLMEVLISMGVLAVGLMGVAALIPAGRHEIALGTRLEYASLVGRSAFRDMEIRGFLKPGTTGGTSYWIDGSGNPMWAPAAGQPPFNYQTPFTYTVAANQVYDTNYTSGPYTNQVSVAIDPLAIYSSAGGYGNRFPYNAQNYSPATAPTSPRPLTRIAPFDLTALTPANRRAVFDSLFRSSVDLITTADTTSKDLPPHQFWFKDATTPTPNPIRRGSDGNYSWLATITSDPTKPSLGGEVTVSVAVFYKRDLSRAGAGEFIAQGVTYVAGSTAELQISNIISNTAPPQTIKGVRPGQWVLLAGTLGTDPYYSQYRWVKVFSAGPLSGGVQRLSVSGDWAAPASRTDVWIFDNVVAVYEKTMTLDLN